MNTWLGNYFFFLVTKLESTYAIAAIFEDSDSEGGATSEVDPVKNLFYYLNFFGWYLIILWGVNFFNFFQESECDFRLEVRWQAAEVVKLVWNFGCQTWV